MANSTTIAIPRIRYDRDQDLRKILKGRDHPVILEGFVAQWPAFGRWTPSYFAGRYGDRNIVVEKSRLSPVPTEPAAYLTQRYYDTANLGETVSSMLDRGNADGGYITYAAIFSEMPELKDDIVPLHEESGFPHWMPVWMRKRLVLRPGFWLGPKGVSSPMHFDRHENLNVQLYGRKRWVLFSPRQSSQLYYKQNHDMPVIFSPVDMTCPDLDRFPRLAEAQRHDVVLEAGEILYLPSGWWHFVESLSDSININYWWWSPRAVRTVCRIELATLWIALRRKWHRRHARDVAGKPTSMPL